MNEPIDDLILGHLKALRNELRTAKSDIQSDLYDIKERLASLEHNLSNQNSIRQSS